MAIEYLVVIEGSEGSYSAFVPDLPGCVAAGSTRDEVEGLITEAIPLHVESLHKHGEAVPPRRSEARYVTV